MKLIIDILENLYQEIMDNADEIQENGCVFDRVILNGTPLPKRHGRIIDESQVTGTFIWDNGYIECYAPTIIEADKESEDKE